MPSDIFETLLRIVQDLGLLIVQIISLGLHWSLLLVWTAWWLWGVNWGKLRSVLAQGAWAPLVLLILVSALVWSRLAPGECYCLGFPVANFWWQLGYIGWLMAYTFFLGWLQGIFHWAPAEISLDPPAHGHDDGHGGHHHSHH